MNCVTKLFVTFCCLVICGVGAILAPTGHATTDRETPNVTPIRNHEPTRRVWILV